MASGLENKFLLFWNGLGGPDLEKEFKFHPTRKWRSDFAYVPGKILIEVEGGIYGGGRHTRISGFLNDCEKYFEAALAGYVVIRLSDKMITTPVMERLIPWVKERAT